MQVTTITIFEHEYEALVRSLRRDLQGLHLNVKALDLQKSDVQHENRVVTRLLELFAPKNGFKTVADNLRIEFALASE